VHDGKYTQAIIGTPSMAKPFVNLKASISSRIKESIEPKFQGSSTGWLPAKRIEVSTPPRGDV
jgi:hypothetical protein